jgi:hypothetical protein
MGSASRENQELFLMLYSLTGMGVDVEKRLHDKTHANMKFEFVS